MQKLYVVLRHWGTWKMLAIELRRPRRLFIIEVKRYYGRGWGRPPTLGTSKQLQMP